MTSNELNKKIINKILEAFELLREYDEGSNELYMSIRKNSRFTYAIRANNDAYKNAVRPLMITDKVVTEDNLKFKTVDIPVEPTVDSSMESFDKAMKEVIKAAEEYGNELHIRTTKIALTTMKEVFRTQLLLDNKK